LMPLVSAEMASSVKSLGSNGLLPDMALPLLAILFDCLK
jgi:hypothetical protein